MCIKTLCCPTLKHRLGLSVVPLMVWQGYATLDLLRSASDAPERERIACEAAGPLFRAAAGLGGAADAAAGGDATGDGELMRELLHVLVADMTGAYQSEGPQARVHSLLVILARKPAEGRKRASMPSLYDHTGSACHSPLSMSPARCAKPHCLLGMLSFVHPFWPAHLLEHSVHAERDHVSRIHGNDPTHLLLTQHHGPADGGCMHTDARLLGACRRSSCSTTRR